MVNSMLIVGSSTRMRGSPSGASASATVSPMSKPSSPRMATISPQPTACFTFSLPRPSNTMSSFTWPFFMEPSFFTKVIGWLGAMLPRVTRPTAIRPWKLL